MVLVGNTSYVGEREVHYLRAFLGLGLILVSHALNDLAAAEIEAWDARVVVLHERPEAIEDVAVVTDDVGGAEFAVLLLLEHGYEYIACLGGVAQTPAVGDPVSDHVEGWRRAMDEAGISTEGRLLRGPLQPLRRLPGRPEDRLRSGAPALGLLLHRRPGDRPAAGRARTADRGARRAGGGRLRRPQGSGADRPVADDGRLGPFGDGACGC
ncbi:hypothetical protein SHIRM173S_07991 [Streptomyces hirsutus]